MPPGGVAVILIRQGRVLLGRRSAGKTGGGTWAPPGGKVEPDETADACARRELLEETGLLVGSLIAIGEIRDHFDDGRPWNTLFFATDWSAGEPQLLEPDAHTMWRWCHPAVLPWPLFQPFAALVQSGTLVDLVARSERPIRNLTPP